MRKLILSVMTTLDGFFEAPGEGLERIDWQRADEEVERRRSFRVDFAEEEQAVDDQHRSDEHQSY